MFIRSPALQLISCVALSLSVSAAVASDYILSIKDHLFTPAELEVPAGQRVKLVVKNEDSTPEEFESYTLNREKVIPGNSQAVIFVGPLEPGRYEFFGEFHEDSAKGVLIAR